MVRTVISLDEDDKAWLDARAKEEGVPMTELIRRAVRLLRQRGASEADVTEALLDRTRGIARLGDGLEVQRRLRDEW